MDYLRSCYRTRMKLWRDSDEETPVRWFFCDPGAEVYEAESIFRSRNWLPTPKEEITRGEVWDAPRPYDRGANTGGFLGTNHCGSEEAFRLGGRTGIDPPHEVVDGQCGCCDGADLEEPIGIEVGGGEVSTDESSAGGIEAGGVATWSGGPVMTSAGGPEAGGIATWGIDVATCIRIGPVLCEGGTLDTLLYTVPVGYELDIRYIDIHHYQGADPGPITISIGGTDPDPGSIFQQLPIEDSEHFQWSGMLCFPAGSQLFCNRLSTAHGFEVILAGYIRTV